MILSLVLAYLLPEGVLTEVSLQAGFFMMIVLSLVAPSRDEKTHQDLLAGTPFWIGVFFWIFGYPYGGTILIIGLILTGVLIAYFKSTSA
jgi:hypothetical protein